MSKTNWLFSLKIPPRAKQTSVDKWRAQVPGSYFQMNLLNVNVRFLAGNSLRLFLCAPTLPRNSPLTFPSVSGDLRGGNDKNKLSGKRNIAYTLFFALFVWCLPITQLMIESDFDNIQVMQLGLQRHVSRQRRQKSIHSGMPLLPKLSINRDKACFQCTIYTYVFYGFHPYVCLNLYVYKLEEANRADDSFQ